MYDPKNQARASQIGIASQTNVTVVAHGHWVKKRRHPQNRNCITYMYCIVVTGSPSRVYGEHAKNTWWSLDVRGFWDMRAERHW